MEVTIMVQKMTVTTIKAMIFFCYYQNDSNDNSYRQVKERHTRIYKAQIKIMKQSKELKIMIPES